ncbi:SAM-dependent methyltransferase [Kitasatospora aureofaciens]|uniref:SAM-dependent methyltransferase n=1 Tax=Kitasatospora aureofaciens TaxID=1894 RepID=UPI0034025159
MDTEEWLADTRTSYDTVATSFADQVRGLLDQTPYERAALTLFADLVRTTGGGPVADLGCGPGRITAYLRGLGIGSVFAHFRRVLRPGGPLLLGFHVGDESRLKTQGYGGHPMKVYVHRRRPGRMAAWLNDAGFTVEAQMTLSSAESTLGGILFARRRPAVQ